MPLAFLPSERERLCLPDLRNGGDGLEQRVRHFAIHLDKTDRIATRCRAAEVEGCNVHAVGAEDGAQCADEAGLSVLVT